MQNKSNRQTSSNRLLIGLAVGLAIIILAVIAYLFLSLNSSESTAAKVSTALTPILPTMALSSANTPTAKPAATATATATAAPTATADPEAQLRTLIEAANEAQIETLRTLNVEPILPSITGEELARIKEWIQQLQQQNQYIEAVLHSIEFTLFEFTDETHARVETKEVWSSNFYNNSGEQVRQTDPAELPQAYLLEKIEGDWKITLIEFLGQ